MRSNWLSIIAIFVSTVAIGLVLIVFVKLSEYQHQACDVSIRQRSALVQQMDNTRKYLKSPAGQENNGLNDFIRAFSYPQLKLRVRTETVPPSCRDQRAEQK